MEKAQKKTKRSRARPPNRLKGLLTALSSLFSDRLNAAAAFSLAHLLFLRLWIDHAIPLENAYFDYTRKNASWQNLAGLWLAALVLFVPLTYLFACATRTTKTLVAKSAAWTIVLLFLAQAILICNVMGQTGTDPFHSKNLFFGSLSADTLWLILGQSTLLLLWALLRHSLRLILATRMALVLIAPFPFFISAQILADLFNSHPRSSLAGEVTPPTEKTKLNRTVVIVFDELDYHLVFENEAKLSQYPNFLQFKKHSLSATNALPPSQNTLLTLPSYWFGKNVIALSVKSREAPQFMFFGETNDRGLASAGQLFSQAAGYGANTEIVGWAHPYCELFGRQVARCLQSSYLEPNNGAGVGDSFVQAIKRSSEVLSLMGISEPTMVRRAHLEVYQLFLERALSAVGNASRDLVFLHLPVPHEPTIYSRATKNFVAGGALVDASYDDNVALADEMLGLLKREMQTRGLWESTSVLLVSDHAYRHTARGESGGDQNNRFRVPFLLKPALTEPPAATYELPFSTRVVGPLTLQLLTGKTLTIDSIRTWLNQQRGFDRAFITAAYAGGKKRCLHHPFTSQPELFSMRTEFDPDCARTNR